MAKNICYIYVGHGFKTDEGRVSHWPIVMMTKEQETPRIEAQHYVLWDILTPAMSQVTNISSLHDVEGSFSHGLKKNTRFKPQKPSGNRSMGYILCKLKKKKALFTATIVLEEINTCLY